MRITSPAFNNNDAIPPEYTCDGANDQPEFDFENVPVETKSLVLIVEDPDAPNGTFTHWVLFNISPALTRIKENEVPADAKEGLSSTGQIGYIGPCPPKGTHRYFFKLFALGKVLNLDNEATRDVVEREMQGHIIDKTELIGLYSRLKP